MPQPTIDQLDHTIAELHAMETQFDANTRSLQDRIRGLQLDLQSTVIAQHAIGQRRRELEKQRVDLVFAQEDVTQELTTYTADSTQVIANNDFMLINESPTPTSTS